VRPFEVAELDHVVLRCRDQPAMLAFYTGVLGLVEERRVDAIGLVQLRAGRSMLDLIPAAADPGGVGSLDHFCLDVEAAGLEVVAAYLETRGAAPLGPPMETYGAHGMGASIYVRDPEDNVVELKVGPRVG
jgi:glyoxylase I family protein